ncbi:hypothetical protein GPALN_012345 [Globodera pallida]|nr:hypothetical protein GPALN_012345 [Globodera pallida]
MEVKLVLANFVALCSVLHCSVNLAGFFSAFRVLLGPTKAQFQLFQLDLVLFFCSIYELYSNFVFARLSSEIGKTVEQICFQTPPPNCAVRKIRKGEDEMGLLFIYAVLTEKNGFVRMSAIEIRNCRSIRKCYPQLSIRKCRHPQMLYHPQVSFASVSFSKCRYPQLCDFSPMSYGRMHNTRHRPSTWETTAREDEAVSETTAREDDAVSETTATEDRAQQKQQQLKIKQYQKQQQEKMMQYQKQQQRKMKQYQKQ